MVSVQHDQRTLVRVAPNLNWVDGSVLVDRVGKGVDIVLFGFVLTVLELVRSCLQVRKVHLRLPKACKPLFLLSPLLWSVRVSLVESRSVSYAKCPP